MLDRYKDFINEHLSDIKDQKILLAVSGGIDSMVMLDLSVKADLRVAVAHVNHGMRGLESDLDEALVKEMAVHYGIEYHVYRFSDQEKSSFNFQERAREIRYRWWNNLCVTNDYKYVFTAHHSSDVVETFLMNLTRGSGIKGLSSIPLSNKNIFRPLYTFSKSDVVSYAKLHKVEYREDESNSENKYRRNEIRNSWLPYLQSKVPNLDVAIAKSASILSREQSLLLDLVQSSILDHSEIKNTGYQLIRLNELVDKFSNNVVQLLYQYFSKFGFSLDNCKKCLSADTGSEFHSESHELLKDRGNLILRRKIDFTPFYNEVSSFGRFKLDDRIELLVSQEFTQSSLTISGLQFPFIVRNKHAGDKFSPSGMQGATKKLKDFLTNAKLDKWSKQSTLVVEKDNTIVAVLPNRVAHGFDDDTAKSIYISIQYFVDNNS